MCDQCEEEGINDDPKGRSKVKGYDALEEYLEDPTPKPSFIQKVVKFIVLPWTPFINPILDAIAMWGFKREMSNMLSDAMEGLPPKRMTFEVKTRDGRVVPLDMFGGAISARGVQIPGRKHRLSPPSVGTDEEEEDLPPLPPVPNKKGNRRPKNREEQIDMMRKMFGE